MSPTWHNHTGNQKCSPERIVEPKSLADLIDLVKAAEAAKTTVRAVGAGHAWSDAALTEGWLIEPTHLSGVTLPVRRSPRRRPARRSSACSAAPTSTN